MLLEKKFNGKFVKRGFILHIASEAWGLGFNTAKSINLDINIIGVHQLY